jgi:hypothetical protein
MAGMDDRDRAADKTENLVENPLVSRGSGDSANIRTELESALAGLRDGSVSEGDAMAVMERMVDARIDTKLQLKAGGAVTGHWLEVGVKAVVAQLTEAPTNCENVTCKLLCWIRSSPL